MTVIKSLSLANLPGTISIIEKVIHSVTVSVLSSRSTYSITTVVHVKELVVTNGVIFIRIEQMAL